MPLVNFVISSLEMQYTFYTTKDVSHKWKKWLIWQVINYWAQLFHQ